MQDFVTTIRFLLVIGNEGKRAGHARDVDPAHHTQLGIVFMVL